MADNNLLLSQVHDWTEALLEQWEGYFLVDARLLQNNQIKVFIDADQGASIDELARINRTLRKKIEESDLFPEGNFVLEVSSPGLDEPLRQLRQYKKNIGREIEVVLKDGRKKKGVLDAANDTFIILAYKQKKKGGKKPVKQAPEKEPEKITFEEIKTTKVCVGF